MKLRQRSYLAEGRKQSRGYDETTAEIERAVKGLDKHVPLGGWGHVKEILTFLYGNEMDMNAAAFLRGLKKGDLGNYYIDDRVLSGAAPASSGYGPLRGKVGKRQVVQAVKALKAMM